MLLSLQTCFDHGLTVGYNDAAFRGLAVAATGDVDVPPVTRPAPSILLDNPFGDGLRLELPVDVAALSAAGWRGLVARWVEAAGEYQRDWQQHVEAGRGVNRDARAAGRLLADHRPVRCTYEVYAIGVAFLRLDFDRFPVADAADAEHLLNCYEGAAYRVGMTAQILDVVTRVMARVRPADPALPGFTHRPPPKVSQDSYRREVSNLIPCVENVLVCGPGEYAGAVAEAHDRFGADPTERFPFFDVGTLHYKWNFKVVESGGGFHGTVNRDRDHILHLLQVTTVAWTLCRIFEVHFLALAVTFGGTGRAGPSGDPPRIPYLRRLRTLAHFLSEASDLHLSTFSQGDRAFFAHYDRASGLAESRLRLRRLSDTLHGLFEDEARDPTDREAGILSAILFWLSIVGTFSAVAGLIGGADFKDRAGPIYRERLLVTGWVGVTLIAVAVLVSWVLIRRRSR